MPEACHFSEILLRREKLHNPNGRTDRVIDALALQALCEELKKLKSRPTSKQ
jgi:hypothetical protein